jgi:hypothetical protein
MPRFAEIDSLIVGVDPIAGFDRWGVDLTDAASAHGGVWHGGLIATYFTIHDFTPYHGWEGEVDILDIPAGADWKFRVTGASLWFDVTYSAAGISQCQIGTNTPTWNNIIFTGFVPSGTKTFFGDLDSSFNFNRARMVQPGESIRMYWSTNADSTVAGGFTAGVWGYLVPDVAVAGS